MKTPRGLKGGYVSDRDVRKLWESATPEFRAWALKVTGKSKYEKNAVALDKQPVASVPLEGQC